MTRSRFLRRYWGIVGVLLLGALLVSLAGNSLLPLIDRDEPRFAQASRQMLQSGDWTVPQFLDKLRLNKPILIYWLQASSMRVFGETAFAARLPSVIASVLTLAFLAATLPRIIGHRRTLWTIFIFATALLPAYIAKVCMADAVLHLWIIIPMICLYEIWRGTARWPTMLVLGVTIGLSMLTKGPPVFLYLGMTVLALWAINTTVETRGIGRTIVMESVLPRVFVRVLVVAAIAVAICLPWVIGLERRHPGAIASMFTTEIVERGFDDKEGHSGPFGYYALTFWGTYFPWCLFWPAAIWQAWKRRELPWVRFSLAAVLGPWLFLEIYQTKLPHYWLPSYPFMAILTADVLLRGARGVIVDLRDKPFQLGVGIWAVATCLMGVGILILPFAGPWSWLGYLSAIVLAIGFAVLAWGVFTLLHAKRILPAALMMGLGFWALLALTTTAYWPNTPSLTLAKRVGDTLAELKAIHPGDAQMIGFKEASSAFYEGGSIREQSNGRYFDITPESEWPRWTIVDARTWDGDPKHPEKYPGVSAEKKQRLLVRKSFTGSNFAGGDWKLTVHILEKKVQPTTMPVAEPSTSLSPQ